MSAGPIAFSVRPEGWRPAAVRVEVVADGAALLARRAALRPADPRPAEAPLGSTFAAADPDAAEFALILLRADRLDAETVAHEAYHATWQWSGTLGGTRVNEERLAAAHGRLVGGISRGLAAAGLAVAP